MAVKKKKPKKINFQKLIGAIIIIIIILCWSFFMYNYDINIITNKLGVTNSYIILFITAFIGGSSILFVFPYYLLSISLGAAGLNPFLIGISAGLGIMLGDATSYFVGYSSREFIHQSRFDKYIKKINIWCEKKSGLALTIFFFIYGAFIPLPNDVVVVPMGIIRHRYWKVLVPLGIGNIVFNTWLAIFGVFIWQIL